MCIIFAVLDNYKNIGSYSIKPSVSQHYTLEGFFFYMHTTSNTSPIKQDSVVRIVNGIMIEMSKEDALKLKPVKRRSRPPWLIHKRR